MERKRMKKARVVSSSESFLALVCPRSRIKKEEERVVHPKKYRSQSLLKNSWQVHHWKPVLGRAWRCVSY